MDLLESKMRFILEFPQKESVPILGKLLNKEGKMGVYIPQQPG